MRSRILVCDDEELIRWSLSEHLSSEGYTVAEAEDGQACLDSIEDNPPDALLVDIKMPKRSGLEVLQLLREQGHTFPVIVMTAHGGIDSAIEATKLGACGYVSKPFDLREISLEVASALKTERLKNEVRYLRADVAKGYEKLTGKSASMQAVFEMLSRIEKVDAPTVLLTGESGTGKDLVAQAIHSRGLRKNQPFMTIDCASLPSTLIESTLFGYEKGAFTDAKIRTPGLFEVASGGIVFLDEIGELELTLQSKLLRVLENRTYRRVGGTQELPVDVGLVAATNRDLENEVKEGRFRQDLFYRLNVVPIHLPALRQRRDDISLIMHSILKGLKAQLRREVDGVTEDAMEVLVQYSWPGNARELRNVLERAVILSGDRKVLQLADLPPELVHQVSGAPPDSQHFVLPEEEISLEAVERSLIEQALERHEGNQTRAAKALGLTRYALRYRLDKHKLKKP